MSFPANISKHRLALLEMLEESFREPGKRSVLRTRGISMEPLVRERDEVVIQAVDPAAIERGDVIAFRAGEMLFVHRVACVVFGPEGRLFYEKGDANMYLAAVQPARILGQVVEVGAGGRRLDLRSRRFRALGRWAAGYGVRAVQVYGALRQLGQRAGRPGNPLRRLGRATSYQLLQLPLRLLLHFARRYL